jgi:diguanylate cyclase (GGDEF)-like protein/PAS domain S-box-containing protein
VFQAGNNRMRTETTQIEHQASKLRWRATFVLVCGLLLSFAAWWLLAFQQNPALATWVTALPMVTLVATLALWWLLRHAAQQHHLAARLADSLQKQVTDRDARLASVLGEVDEGLLHVSANGEILDANPAAVRLFGHAVVDLRHAHLSLLLPGVLPNGTRQDLETFLHRQHRGADGSGPRTEGRRANGQSFALGLSVHAITTQGPTLYQCWLRDLSAQDATERAMLAAQCQLNEVDEMRRIIVHNAPYAVFVLNRQGIFQTVNPAGERLLGCAAHDLIGHSTTQRYFDPAQVAERAHLLALRLNQPVTDLDVVSHLAHESPGLPTEWRLTRNDGSSLMAEILVTELNNEYGARTGFLLMAHDVTARHEAEHQVQHMALHDALTGLPNRNMLQEQLKACLNIAQREQGHMALMFIDLDRFKKINDGLGHHVGDSVLIEVGRRLRAAMRSSDIVARLGGDEFVVLLPRIQAQTDGDVVAAKVLEVFTDPVLIGEQELRVTPSIGVALYPDHGTDAATLMRHADLAMYQAKKDGRNRIQIYSEHMVSPSPDTLLLENDLYHALTRDELRLHYQPQFDCTSGRITGAEALLRWEHKGRLIAPSDFIPLAEESGLIVPMGEWVLRQACTVAHRWRQETGVPLRMAVNLSAVQLDRHDIVRTVSQVLQDTGLPATALELEITESVVVRESLRAADILRQLRALGVGIAIDDFGVGYSSFAYLRELPVNRFKLDRSFLAGVPQSHGDTRLVAALIAMGHRLEVGIVAEGVETAEQADFLRDHGCDEAQGYHLGRPLRESEFEALLKGLR